MERTIYAYRRENGKYGIRNHVVILPLDDLSNAAAEGVAKLIQGTLALPHPYGRLQFGADLELFFRTLIGTGSNPNVAAVVVIGIEPNWTNRVVEGIAATKKPVEGFAIEGHGDLKTIERASRAAKEFVHWASELKREPVRLFDPTFSTKCGESDTTSGLASNPAIGVVTDRLVQMGGTMLFGETSEVTGGEHVLARRVATPELREKFLKVHRDYVKFIEDQGVDLFGSQPTQGNIAGGLTTIEEKAMGNIQKAGTSPVVGVLEPAEAPAGPGLHFMDTSSAAAECVTLFGAAGSVLHLFTTGQGNIIGHPIVPVIKISANPKTVATMSEHIDVDISGVLRREMTLSQAGDRIMGMMVRTANGRLTAAEVLGHREFVLTKLYRSA
ncbi:MAG TPA: UxaA family hydrolase [Candidatus Binatia bacterium]|nr:UxaA family hydrolase [Candidatus Binatia bacterium]